MSAFLEDDRPRSKKPHEMGEDISSLSVHELGERIALLETEIKRLEKARVARQATKSAAEGFFKM